MIGLLVSPNPITDKDSEEIRIAKDILEEAKRHMKEYLKEGGDPDFFLQHYHNELLKAWKKRQDAEAIAQQMLEDDGDLEMAREFVRKVNEDLNDEGIQPIHLDTSDYK